MSLTTALFIAAALLLTGCGDFAIIEDRSNDYMFAEQGGVLIVPEWYSNSRLKDRFPIPKADKSFVVNKEFEVPAPPEPSIAIMQQQFVIKTALEDTWLLAGEPPGKMWPALKAHWEFFGGIVDELDTSTGVMEVTFKTSSLKARQFMERNDLLKFGNTVVLDVSVEQGLKRRSSEIRIVAVADQKIDQTMEKQLLTSISRFLSNRADSFESYSLAAQNIGNRDKLVLINEADNQYIRVDLNFARAWHAVGEALARSNIPIIDWNREEGTYYVNYEAPKKKEGWLPGLFDFNNKDQLSDSFNFIIELSTSEDGVHIVSLPVSGLEDDQDRIRLLNQLLDNMS
jgi:outer membrane protein assembly factor BamC